MRPKLSLDERFDSYFDKYGKSEELLKFLMETNRLLRDNKRLFRPFLNDISCDWMESYSVEDYDNYRLAQKHMNSIVDKYF